MRWVRNHPAWATVGVAVTASVFVLVAGGLAVATPNNGAPSLAFAPSSAYDFGNVTVGQSASQTFTLTNVGGRASRALTSTTAGDDSFAVTNDTCSGRSLGPDKSCTLNVTFAPGGPGTRQATITAIGVHDVAQAALSLSGNGTTAQAITTGAFHSCALRAGGTVDCWGAAGQLGNGTYTDSNVPMPVSNLSGVIAISAGGGHTCALSSDATVKCWGNNFFGELGNPSITGVAYVPVPVINLSGVTAISAGAGHTCALLEGGTVECWGFNSFGQLGNGTNTDTNAPVPVANLNGVLEISAGAGHTCALLHGGTIDCWGSNIFGELGNGTNTDSNVPVPVANLSGVVTISTGANDTCALLEGGTVDCWGRNDAGQLGNGTNTGSNLPVPVDSLSAVIAISAGELHTCASLSDGSADCWGNNFFGQLGNGSNADSNVPVPVANLGDTIAISAGAVAHTCAMSRAGTVDCWGSNMAGQLGDGTNTDSNTPVPVTGIPSNGTASMDGSGSCGSGRHAANCDPRYESSTSANAAG